MHGFESLNCGLGAGQGPAAAGPGGGGSCSLTRCLDRGKGQPTTPPKGQVKTPCGACRNLWWRPGASSATTQAFGRGLWGQNVGYGFVCGAQALGWGKLNPILIVKLHRNSNPENAWVRTLKLWVVVFYWRNTLLFSSSDHEAHWLPWGTNESALHIQYATSLNGLRASLFFAATVTCRHHLSALKKVAIGFGICSFHSCDSDFKQADNSLEGQAALTTPMSSCMAFHSAFFADLSNRWVDAASAFWNRAPSCSLRRPRHKPVVPPKWCLHLTWRNQASVCMHAKGKGRTRIKGWLRAKLGAKWVRVRVPHNGVTSQTFSQMKRQWKTTTQAHVFTCRSST